MKRILALLMLLATVFLLCACPGGSPVEPPVTNPCPDCGKSPCECEKDPPQENCPVCGMYPCQCDIDENIVYGDGAAMAGTGDTLQADAPALSQRPYDEGSATDKSGADLFRQEFFGNGVIRVTDTSAYTLKNQKNKTYGGVAGTAVLIPAGLTLANNEQITIKNAVIVGDLEISSGKQLVFENVQFVGSITIKNRASDVVFKDCRLSSLNSAAENLSLINCFVSYNGVGVTSEGNGLYVKNCRFEGTGTALSSAAADAEIRNVTVKGDENGIGIEVKGAEAVNTLIATSAIRGVQTSILIDSACNTVAVLNSLISVKTLNNTNVYVCENAMGGRLIGESNNYFLANGNTYAEDGRDHRPILSGNENTNGDTITNVSARAEVGANEDLLPHLNKELFVGMERKLTVKEYGVAKEMTLYSHILEKAKSEDIVIIAPGAYAVDETAAFSSLHNGTTIYAYGVLAEGVALDSACYNKSHITTFGVTGLAIKGLSIGYEQPSCGQVYILEKLGNNEVKVITAAGFWNEFTLTGSNFIRNTGDCSYVKAGTNYIYGELMVKSTTKNSDGTMTVKFSDAAYYDLLKKGDILTQRADAYSWVVHTRKSQDILLEDFTQYGYAGGYAFYEEENLSGTVYHRVADTTKAATVIDKDTYERYSNLEKEYGVDLEIDRERIDGKYRYRGPAPKISSLDGMHATASTQGSQMISCIVENMTDDGMNMNAYHARLGGWKDNGDGTLTLIYKACLTSRLWGQGKLQPDGKRKVDYIRYCADFREGDRVYIYNAAGQLFCDTKALSAGWEYDTIKSTYDKVVETDIVRYAVKVNKDDVDMSALDGYDLTNDSQVDSTKVLVDNMSRSSADFLVDNCYFHNGSTNGVRAKCGTVKHTTFRDIAKTALSAVYDIWWGESVVANDLLFEKNLIDHTSYNTYGAPTLDHPSADYKYTAICIMGLGDGKIMDEDRLLFKNIIIRDNKFMNRSLSLYNYLVFIRSAANVQFTGNDFGSSEEEDGLDKLALVLYLNGAVNIDLSGNTYSPFIEGMIERYVEGDSYKDIHGSDVGDRIKDKEPAPEPEE